MRRPRPWLTAPPPAAGEPILMVEDAVDIHVHILPGMDDGAQNYDEALAMAEIAEKHGTSVLAATPHVDFSRCNGSGKRSGGRADTIRRNVARLADIVASSGLRIRILPGMEVVTDPDLVRFVQDGEAVTIGDSGKYVLVELPFQHVPVYTDRVIFDLSSYGYVPVIAHPERNAEIARDPNRLYPLVRAGAIGQINAGSLVGELGRNTQRAAEILLAQGLAQVIASDGHSPTSRSCRLDKAFAAASRVVGEGAALRAVRDVPRAIAFGEHVVLEEPEKYAPKRRFFFGIFANFVGKRSRRF